MLYVFILLGLLPATLCFAGALLRLKRARHRTWRFELIGASFMVVAVFSRWLVTDPNFGLDPYELSDFTYTFKRAEGGAFFIGLLIFGCGFFLERRPGPGLRPWPWLARVVGWAAILLFGSLALVAQWYISLPWLDLPWGIGRYLFMLGLLPFAATYLWRARRDNLPPPDNTLDLPPAKEA